MASESGPPICCSHEPSVIGGMVASGRLTAARGQQGEPGARVACAPLMAPPAPRRRITLRRCKRPITGTRKPSRSIGGGASPNQPHTAAPGGRLVREKSPAAARTSRRGPLQHREYVRCAQGAKESTSWALRVSATVREGGRIRQCGYARYLQRDRRRIRAASAERRQGVANFGRLASDS